MDIGQLLRLRGIETQITEIFFREKLYSVKHKFQIEYLEKIYFASDIKFTGLVSNIILQCSKKFQAEVIYNIFANMETEKEKYLDTYIENSKLIIKSKKEIQSRNMYNFLNNLDNENASYVLKYSEYFLKTTDEDKLNSLYRYLTYSLRQNLLVEEEKVNLIINARNKFNSDAIEGSLTFGPLIDTDLDGEAAEILNSSRKEYNAKYAKSLVNIGSVDGLSGAMIVNESETKYKAEQVHSIISLYANTDEIKRSLEFAALINSVHTKLEIDLIYLLSQNSYLNKLGIDLPIARIIANATESEYDAIIIWECLKDEENRKNAINGFVSLIKNINPKSRQKAENIINLVLMKAQNKPIHLDVVDEVVVTNEKLTNKVKKLINKKLKK